MDRKTKGRLGEIKALEEFIRQGYEAYLPWSDNSKFDLLVSKDSKVFRVSVKFTSTAAPSGNWLVGLRQVSRRNGGTVNVDKFDNSNYDLLAVYIEPEDRVVLLDCTNIKSKSELTVRKMNS